MPCRGPDENEIAAWNNRNNNNKQDEIDSLSRWLCYVLTNYDIPTSELPEGEGSFKSPTEWWKEHQRLDRIRRERESMERKRKRKEDLLKKKAEGVFTPDELENLKKIL